MTDFNTLRGSLDHFLLREIEADSFPSAVYVVGTSTAIVAENALGNAVVTPEVIPAQIDTIYDIASLTKPLVTATLALLAVRERLIALDDRVARWVGELPAEKRDITFADLLSHRSGFQAWYPLYREGRGAESYLQSIVRRPLAYEPRTKQVYSDVGYILCAIALQRLLGRSLMEVARDFIFQPLGLRRSLFNPPPELLREIAATERGNPTEDELTRGQQVDCTPMREYLIWGEVNDGHAFHMGGYSGSAGLFSTAREVYQLGRVYVTDVLLPRELREEALMNYTAGMDENRGIGWQLYTPKELNPSRPLSPRSFGHTGFTGTSIWLDPERDLIAVLLTNRLHSTTRANMQAIRQRFHEVIVANWQD